MRILIMLALIIFPFAVFSMENEIDDVYGSYLISGTERSISMDLESVSLNNVLKALSRQSGFNFVSTEAVKERKLTLYFKDVPLKNAMDIIFKANSLSYDYFPNANIFVVKETGKPRIELKTKVYSLKYARLKYSRFQQEIDDLMTGETSDSNSSNSSSDDDAVGIFDAVKGVLTKNGKVTKDDYANSLVIVDVPSQFPIIDKVISKLDRPQPKVMIEVEMLDVSKDLVDRLGVDYTNGLTAQFTGGSFVTSFPFGDKFFKKHGGEKGATGSGVSLSSLTGVLKFLSTDTTTKFLARPKILTMSNETAQVNITTNEAIGVTRTDTDTGSSSYEIERTDTGTMLKVTPQVDPLSHEITMLVEVYNREAKDSDISLETMTSGKLKNPEERGTRSVVRLKDGQTLLIGGLIRQDNNETKDKVPFLGDIPFLGSMFRYKAKENKNRELLVFLTPHIMRDSNTNLFEGVRQPLREQSLFLRDKAVNIALDRFSKR